MNRIHTPLFKSLEQSQNREANQNRDILSLTPLMDDEQFIRHVVRNCADVSGIYDRCGNREEATAVCTLVSLILSKGYSIRLLDEEELLLKPTNSLDKILAAIAHSDYNVLELYRDGIYVGGIEIYYGNEPCEIISDCYADNEQQLAEAADIAKHFSSFYPMPSYHRSA